MKIITIMARTSIIGVHLKSEPNIFLQPKSILTCNLTMSSHSQVQLTTAVLNAVIKCGGPDASRHQSPFWKEIGFHSPFSEL